MGIYCTPALTMTGNAAVEAAFHKTDFYIQIAKPGAGRQQKSNHTGNNGSCHGGAASPDIGAGFIITA